MTARCLYQTRQRAGLTSHNKAESLLPKICWGRLTAVLAITRLVSNRSFSGWTNSTVSANLRQTVLCNYNETFRILSQSFFASIVHYNGGRPSMGALPHIPVSWTRKASWQTRATLAKSLTTYWLKIVEKTQTPSFGTFLGVISCEFFDESYLPRN